MRINKHDTQGTKPLLGKGELGYDDYTAGGDAGRVYVGTGAENIAVAKKSEVDIKLNSSEYTAADVLTKIKTVDGTGSGLDADLLDGMNSSTANTANTIVARDASGNFTAGIITANLTGNASTATTLQTGRLINGTSFNGGSDITTAKWGTSRNITIGNTTKAVDGSAAMSWSIAEMGVATSGHDHNGMLYRGNTTDFNTSLTEGTYNLASATSITNAPYTGAIYGTLVVYVNDGTTHNNSTNNIQQAFNDINGKKFTRSKYNANAWTTWLEVTKYVTNVTAGSGVVVSGTAGTAWTPTISLANIGTAGTYTKVTTNAQGQVTSGTTLSASDIPFLDASKITSGVIDAARLPAYVDDVLEFTNLATFPVTGESGKIYIALDTNKTYRWSGSVYVYITSGAVDSVNGMTGVVTVSTITGNAGTATTLQTARAIATSGDVVGTATSFNGSANITIPMTLANVGTAGTYTKVTTDAKGRITSGTTLSASDIPTLNQSTTGSAATLTTARTVQTNLGSTASASFDGSANITPGVTGTLPVGNGGTGATTLTGIVKGNGTGAMTAATAGTDYVIPSGSISGNAGTATALQTARTINGVSFDGSANISVNTNNSEIIKFDSGTTEGTDLYTFNGSSAKTIDIKAGTNVTLTKAAGSITISANDASIAWSEVTSKPTTLAGYGITDAASSSHVGATGTAHGNATTSVAGFMSNTDKTKLDGIATGANNYVHPTSGVTSGSYAKVTVDANGHVTAGAIPTMEDIPDATFKRSVRCATTANIAATYASNVLTSSAVGVTVIDGITVALNDRVLIKDQSTSAHNGIYRVSVLGTASVATVFTRTSDADSITELASALVAVDSGTVNGGRLFDNDLKTTDTLGTTAMVWSMNLDDASLLVSTSASIGAVRYNGTTAAAGQFDGGTTTPTGSNRLNYGGYFYPTSLNLSGTGDTTTASSHVFVETGSDGFVRPKTLANFKTEIFASPTLVTPNIGVATGTSFNSITGLSSTAPAMNGTASVGAEVTVARADHVHPTDTSRAATNQTMYIGTTSMAINRGSATQTLTGVSIDGNAATATKLQTARTINGVSFDGSANINIEDRLGSAIASAATTTVGTAGLGDYMHITGTTTITSFGTASAPGVRRTLIFDGALQITHNATSLICPGAANIVTVAGTVIEVVSETTTNWRVVSITHPSVSMVELGYLDGVTSNIQNQLNSKAPLASPVFTGTPSLPTGTTGVTQAVGDSSTKLATTAFVDSKIGSNKDILAYNVNTTFTSAHIGKTIYSRGASDLTFTLPLTANKGDIITVFNSGDIITSIKPSSGGSILTNVGGNWSGNLGVGASATFIYNDVSQWFVLLNNNDYKYMHTVGSGGSIKASYAGNRCIVNGGTVTLPALASLSTGAKIDIWCYNTATTIQRAGTDQIHTGQSYVNSVVIQPGQCATFAAESIWELSGISQYDLSFGSSLASSGYQKLPSGLIIQWGSIFFDVTSKNITYPIAFPNNSLSIVFGQSDTASVYIGRLVGNSNSGFTAVASLAGFNSNWIAIGF